MNLLHLTALLASSLGVQTSPAVYPLDHSLSAQEYVQLGMPAPDRTWGPDDYQRALAVLSQLGSKDPSLLPRFGSESSGVVFERLAARENLSILTVESFPIETRLNLGMELQAAAKSVLMVYLTPASQNVVFDDELAELMGLLLAVTADLADSLEEFRDLLPPDDPKMEVRLQGFERMRSATSEMVAGVLTSVSERETYRTPARRRLSLHVLESVPRLAVHQTDLQRQEIAGRLAALIQEDLDPTIRHLLTQTKAKLE